MFFFDIQPRTPGNGDATIVQRCLYNSMTASIFAGGVVMQFADGIHFLGSLESLCIIDDEKQMAVLFGKQAKQHIQGNLLHYDGLIPVAAPEEFAVIGAMGAVTQRLDEPVDRTAMTDTDRQYHRPEVAINMFGNPPSYRLEKTLQFSGDFADGNHAASMLISAYCQDTYRQMRLFLFDNHYDQNPSNRSV